MTDPVTHVWIEGPFEKDDRYYLNPASWVGEPDCRDYQLGGTCWYYHLRGEGGGRLCRSAETPERALAGIHRELEKRRQRGRYEVHDGPPPWGKLP